MNIVITGATKGIGLAIAHAFAGEGFNLAVCSRNRADLEAFKSSFEEYYPGIQVLAERADVSNREEVYGFADFVKEHWKSLEILVNNAGVYLPGEILEEPDGILEKQVETNLYSAYYLTRKLLPLMYGRRKAHVFNICSIASLAPYPNAGSYSISKFALLGFSGVLRDELRDKGIRVTSISPGATENSVSPALPAGQIMPAEDVASAIVGAWKMSSASVVEGIVIRPQFGHL